MHVDNNKILINFNMESKSLNCCLCSFVVFEEKIEQKIDWDNCPGLCPAHLCH